MSICIKFHTSQLLFYLAFESPEVILVKVNTILRVDLFEEGVNEAFGQLDELKMNETEGENLVAKFWQQSLSLPVVSDSPVSHTHPPLSTPKF